MAMGAGGQDAERLVVFVDSWQQECCGAPWGVGTAVSWTLTDPDDEYLGPIFAAEDQVRIDRQEEHHGGLPDDAPSTRGVVVSIRGVQVQHAPVPGGDGRTLYPVPGSARLTRLTESDGAELGWDGFVGYLVEIDAAGPEAAPGAAQ